MKILFTYGTDTKEGYESRVPGPAAPLLYKDGEVDEIIGTGVLEKVPNLVAFIEECHRMLKTGGVATFTSPYFSTVNAWASPLAVRGICEMSLNFSSKSWREANKYTEIQSNMDFEVGGQFAVDQDSLCRSEETKAFWMKRYSNVVQSVVLTLTKK